MSGEKIPDIVLDAEGAEATDYFTFLKWLYQKDRTMIQERLDPEDIILILTTLSDAPLKKGQVSESENELTEAFQKCFAGMRIRNEIPNTWQEHLLNLLKLLGYSQDEIFVAVIDCFSATDPSIKRTFNQYARAIWDEEIFKDLKE